jgi:hypothetical protein
MTVLDADREAALLKAVAAAENRSARGRAVMAAAILITALSLIASAVLLVQLSRQAAELKQVVQERDTAVRNTRELAERLGAASKTIGSPSSSQADVQEAKETSRQLTELIPAASAGRFALPAEEAMGTVQLLTLGSPKGWDIDVFWCAGPGGEESYRAGRSAAVALADKAVAARPIAPGVRIGNVRLRPIQPGDTPIWRSAMGGRRLLVVTDSGPGEGDAGRAVRKILPASLPAAVVDQATLPNNQAPSKWYLSVIACPAS